VLPVVWSNPENVYILMYTRTAVSEPSIRNQSIVL